MFEAKHKPLPGSSRVTANLQKSRGAVKSCHFTAEAWVGAHVLPLTGSIELQQLMLEATVTGCKSLLQF